ncbi:hypothetical protein SDC9_72422 [bioreactor metagenome]|uniref:Uncharacterized protein n=1 Tax=bioreactor metagenome TaxID=1076179 RepID=A0A644YDG4_9ZZZZ
MGQCHDRLDAVGEELVEDLVVEGEALLVRLGLQTGRVDPRPGDRHAEGGEPHLGEEGDVLLVPVVEVDAPPLGEHAFQAAGVGRVQVCAGDLEGEVVGAVADLRLVTGEVGGRQALAALVVRSLDLVGGGGASPEEILGKCAGVGHGALLHCGVGGSGGRRHEASAGVAAPMLITLSPAVTSPAAAGSTRPRVAAFITRTTVVVS